MHRVVSLSLELREVTGFQRIGGSASAVSSRSLVLATCVYATVGRLEVITASLDEILQYLYYKLYVTSTFVTLWPKVRKTSAYHDVFV